MRPTIPCSAVLALLAIAAAAPASAAPPDPASGAGRAEGFRFGGGALFGSPRGEFGRQVGDGGGLYGQALYALPGGVLGLRADASFFLYGSETIRVPLSGDLPRIAAEVRTDNWIGQLAAGPQLMLPSGRVRPYLHAFAGVSYFSTSSEATDPVLLAPIAESTNFDDYAFCYGGGGGVLVVLGKGRLALEAGGRYVKNGRVSYLAEGDLRDDGHGGVSFSPRRSRADLLELRLGVTLLR